MLILVGKEELEEAAEVGENKSERVRGGEGRRRGEAGRKRRSENKKEEKIRVLEEGRMGKSGKAVLLHISVAGPLACPMVEKASLQGRRQEPQHIGPTALKAASLASWVCS